MDGNDSVDSNISNNDTIDEDSSEDSDDQSSYDSEDEVDPEPIPAVFHPDEGQRALAGQPQKFDVEMNINVQPSPLPLCLMMNCRSACNKENNLRELLNTIARRSHCFLRHGSETENG